MKKISVFLLFLFACVLMQAQTDVIINPKPKGSGGGQRSLTFLPSAYYDAGTVYVTYPYATDMTVAVTSSDGFYSEEQAFCQVTMASIGDLEPGVYTLTITIGDMIFEGEFEVEEEE